MGVSKYELVEISKYLKLKNSSENKFWPSFPIEKTKKDMITMINLFKTFKFHDNFTVVRFDPDYELIKNDLYSLWKECSINAKMQDLSTPIIVFLYISAHAVTIDSDLCIICSNTMPINISKFIRDTCKCANVKFIAFLNCARSIAYLQEENQGQYEVKIDI